MSENELIHETRDGIAFTTLNRPQAMNAFTFAMYEGLAARAAEIGADPAIRAWVITGGGEKAFAAGTDISQFKSFTTAQHALDYEERIGRVLSAVEDCPKPTIAAINGACTGGGAGVAGVCDIRIASATMRFGVPIARTLGNTLSLGNYARFSALLGPARLLELIFTARLVEAEEALRLGLVTEVLPDKAALLDRAEALARTIASHAPLTLQAAKVTLKRLRTTAVADVNADDMVALTFTSADFKEGVNAFLEKRKPVWTGR
ncbi:enoyl-CoA hydratase [Muricoccus radiodurans]|uniref:enoyl-CoA hydratase n=1 Tax=Muricoccus radiodurans TaxID=2231721 RepID=UPI003CF512B9